MNLKNIFKIYISTLIFLSVPLQLKAENSILVRAESVPLASYKTAIEANHDFEGFESYWNHRTEDQDIRRDLRTAFAHAQEIFLQSEISEMKKEWEVVADYALKNDWPIKYRRLIQVAQMRRAQLATTPTETELWLKNIISFDSTFEPDRNLFPPPLVEKYRRLRTQVHRRVVMLGPDTGYDFLLVNGVSYNLDKPKKILVADGEIRTTFISSRYLPVTRIINSKTLSKLQLEKTPIVTGDCSAPGVATRTNFDINTLNLSLMYSKSCVVSVQKANHADSTALNIVTQPAVKYSSPTGIEANFKDSESSTPIYKKTWFWVGATVLAGGLIAISQHRDSPTTQPTRTEGF